MTKSCVIDDLDPLDQDLRKRGRDRLAAAGDAILIAANAVAGAALVAGYFAGGLIEICGKAWLKLALGLA